MSSKKAILIVGPTASGKSQLALKISLNQPMPIVNVDSVQIYKGLKIGSAQPSNEDLKLAPHHLYAYVDKGKKYTAAEYLQDVRELLKHNNADHWIFCGGSGFYLQALEKGMYQAAPPSAEVKKQIEDLVEQKGWHGAHAHMLSLDESLKNIHPNDHYRIRRGLEILLSTKKTRQQHDDNVEGSPLEDFQIKKIGIYADKDTLRQRVQKRVEIMLEQGFVDEVEELLNTGYSEWHALETVGYLQVKQYLEGQLPKAELIEKIVIANMQLIKKQMTWFKRDKEIEWYELRQMNDAVEDTLDWLKV